MEWVLEHWEFLAFIATAILSGVVWLIRLEGKIKHAESVVRIANKRIDELEIEIHSVRDTQNNVISDLLKELKGIQIELAQLKGYLMHDKKPRRN